MKRWMEFEGPASITCQSLKPLLSTSTSTTPSLWRPTAVKSCRAMWVPCSVSSHVPSLKPLDTCQKNKLVPAELDISHFIAIFDYNIFRWVPLLFFVGFLKKSKKTNRNHSSKVSAISFLHHSSLPKKMSQKQPCCTELITFPGHN